MASVAAAASARAVFGLGESLKRLNGLYELALAVDLPGFYLWSLSILFSI